MEDWPSDEVVAALDQGSVSYDMGIHGDGVTRDCRASDEKSEGVDVPCGTNEVASDRRLPQRKN